MANTGYNNSTENGNGTAIIVLALVVLAALIIGAVFFMNNPVTTTSETNTSTTDRTIIEQVPVLIAPDNAANPPAQTAPATEPAPTPVQPITPAQ
ncbi:hypothetical protein [Asticcacaulis sp. AC402]|uniref:hypothetical protein n=1 Tax=Asticcacaulis sp. AC402 TaxID=1282361 RepID=UPI0003C3B88A|nr:hypothetical protein [Asticcacaulis sp. AC402]ESQ76122.1 hypothetical protein ABAC402_06645 [Asticcacaulis sp. AC402]